HSDGEEPANRGVQKDDHRRPRPARAARADGAAAVSRFGRIGGSAGAVEGAQPRGRGEQVAGLQGPRGDDQPAGALADGGVKGGAVLFLEALPQAGKGREGAGENSERLAATRSGG